jgi:phosphatidate cytidylyltransferase
LSRNLIIRIIVALIFGPIIIFISYLGGYWLLGMIMLFAVIGMIEFLLKSGFALSSVLFWLPLISLVSLVYLLAFGKTESALTVFIGFFLVVAMISGIQSRIPSDSFSRQSRLIWGVAYLGFLYPFVYNIRILSPENGGDWLLFLFGAIWLSDTMAMLFGRIMGKRKLAPTVSPNKTIAGFLGGLLGGLIVALIMGFWRLSEIFLAILVGAGIIVSLAGQLGDLAESCWKRAFGIKDSSSIIPGHGGILDRFDSLLFASPMLYWYLKYIVYG